MNKFHGNKAQYTEVCDIVGLLIDNQNWYDMEQSVSNIYVTDDNLEYN